MDYYETQLQDSENRMDERISKYMQRMNKNKEELENAIARYEKLFEKLDKVDKRTYRCDIEEILFHIEFARDNLELLITDLLVLFKHRGVE